MTRILLPSGLGKLCVPKWDFAPHLQEIETLLLALAKGTLGTRKLLISIPIRHGKTELTNLFLAWLLICRPELRILRVMETASTAEIMGATVLRTVDTWAPVLTGGRIKVDPKKRAAGSWRTLQGGLLESVGSTGSVEGRTYDWIVMDDYLSDPYAIRSFSRRDQGYKDMVSKFFSRVNPNGRTKFLYIGSRRHPDDIQARLLKNNEECKDLQEVWAYHHRPAILHEGTDHEEALWATSKAFDLKGLRVIRDEKFRDGVAWEWMSTYQNDPTGSPDMLAFDPEWMRPEKILYSFDSQALPKAKYKVLTTDPSMGAGTEFSDFFASLYLHIAEDGTIFVDDLFLQICKPDMMVPMMAALVGRHQDMDLAAFESNGGGRYAAELIKTRCDSMGLRFPVIFKEYGSRSEDEKISRITLNLFEVLQNGKLKIRDCPMGRQLLAQIQQFPTSKLDGPDALATGIITLKAILS